MHSPAIQLCDVIAELVARACQRRDEDSEFVGKVMEAGFGEITIGGIRPEPKFPADMPAKLDGPDVVDLLTSIMYGPR